MDSIVWLVLLFSVLLLGLLAAITFLQVHLTRSNRETLSFLTKLQESQQEATRSFTTQMLERLSSQNSSAQQEMLSYLQMQQEQVMVHLSTASTAATSSISSTATKLADALTSAQAMIASKDPMAYQVVRGAATPFAGDQGTAPYTSTDDLAMAEAARRKAESDRNADTALKTILDLAGAANVEPFPAAGTGFFAASSPQ